VKEHSNSIEEVQYGRLRSDRVIEGQQIVEWRGAQSELLMGTGAE
jgi:hypothetical protein